MSRSSTRNNQNLSTFTAHKREPLVAGTQHLGYPLFLAISRFPMNVRAGMINPEMNCAPKLDPAPDGISLRNSSAPVAQFRPMASTRTARARSMPRRSRSPSA